MNVTHCKKFVLVMKLVKKYTNFFPNNTDMNLGGKSYLDKFVNLRKQFV